MLAPNTTPVWDTSLVVAAKNSQYKSDLSRLFNGLTNSGIEYDLSIYCPPSLQTLFTEHPAYGKAMDEQLIVAMDNLTRYPLAAIEDGIASIPASQLELYLSIHAWNIRFVEATQQALSQHGVIDQILQAAGHDPAKATELDRANVVAGVITALTPLASADQATYLFATSLGDNSKYFTRQSTLPNLVDNATQIFKAACAAAIPLSDHREALLASLNALAGEISTQLAQNDIAAAKAAIDNCITALGANGDAALQLSVAADQLKSNIDKIAAQQQRYAQSAILVERVAEMRQRHRQAEVHRFTTTIVALRAAANGMGDDSNKRDLKGLMLDMAGVLENRTKQYVSGAVNQQQFHTQVNECLDAFHHTKQNDLPNDKSKSTLSQWLDVLKRALGLSKKSHAETQHRENVFSCALTLKNEAKDIPTTPTITFGLWLTIQQRLCKCRLRLHKHLLIDRCQGLYAN